MYLWPEILKVFFQCFSPDLGLFYIYQLTSEMDSLSNLHELSLESAVVSIWMPDPMQVPVSRLLLWCAYFGTFWLIIVLISDKQYLIDKQTKSPIQRFHTCKQTYKSNNSRFVFLDVSKINWTCYAYKITPRFFYSLFTKRFFPSWTSSRVGLLIHLFGSYFIGTLHLQSWHLGSKRNVYTLQFICLWTPYSNQYKIWH